MAWRPQTLRLTPRRICSTCPPCNCRRRLLDGGSFYPAGVYSATSAQITSLQDLRAEAVTNTIPDHALAATDTEAVESWARPDADAELWALLVQAIQAVRAGTADTDQQNAAAWLNAVVLRQGVLAAQAAGLEYTKWAGLGISALPGPDRQQPERERLAVVPLGRARAIQPTGVLLRTRRPASDGGYCVYQSPSPVPERLHRQHLRRQRAPPGDVLHDRAPPSSAARRSPRPTPVRRVGRR